MATALALGALITACGPAAGSGPDPASPSSPAAAVAEPDGQVADPVRVRIPAIGVDAPIGALEVDGSGVLPPPDTAVGTGWWRAGPEPGERGPAVIVGHVDSAIGPAVFVRLSELEPGGLILVDREDGTTVTFTAARTERHAKDDFPTGSVYDDTATAQLRLITCGGDYDRLEGSYQDNVIVYADQSV